MFETFKPIVEEAKVSGKPLFEDTFSLDFVLEEGTNGEKKPKLKGRFGQVDEATANKRMYPRKIMSREISRLQENIANGQMYGELDHPADGKTSLQRVSHLISELRLDESGEIFGTVDLLPDTLMGKQALAIAKGGGRLGISSRGYGSTVTDTKGNMVVQEDYSLVTFDLVADPANAGAYPKFVMENKENTNMDLETLKSQFPELVEAIKAEVELDSREHAKLVLKEDFASKLEEATEELREECLAEARRELMSDPEVAGANSAMKAIVKLVKPFILREDEESLVSELEAKVLASEMKVARADEERRIAMQEAEELSAMAKEAFFHLHLERSLKDDPRREQIESIIGDVREYDSLDDLSGRVAEVRSALTKEDKVQEESDRRVARLEAEKRILEERMEQVLTLSNQLAVKAYIENRTGGNPQSRSMKTFVESHNPSTKEEVDALVEEFEDRYETSKEYRTIRRGIKSSLTESKVERNPLPTPKHVDEFDVLGVKIQSLVDLSGIKR